MNPNQTLIDYQNKLLQNNLDTIQQLNAQILSLQGTMDYYQSLIASCVNQIDSYNSQITDLENGNTLINDTIAILSQ